MGDCADMVLDGYLDRDGSYSGNGGFYVKRHKHKDTESQKKFWSIKREISARIIELTANGMKENGALNQARFEANKKHGSDWRSLQYH